MLDPDTLAETLEAFQDQDPFHPFTLAMNDGSKLEIDHPRAVVYRNGRGVFLGPGGTPHLFSSHSVNQVIGDLAGNATSGREAA